MSSALTPEGAPLTEQEQQQVSRLFSDPFYFPLQYKTWLQWFIEGVQGGLAGGSISGAGGGSGMWVPVGGIIFHGSNKLPAGFLWTNGAALSRITYNPLFKEIGTIHGAGDGSTTFNVPDIDGRTIVSWVQAGGHADVATIAGTEGVAKNARRPRHRSTVTDPGHAHTVFLNLPSAGGVNMPLVGQSSNATDNRATSTNGTGISIGPQTGLEPVDTPAYIVLPAIIRYI